MGLYITNNIEMSFVFIQYIYYINKYINKFSGSKYHCNKYISSYAQKNKNEKHLNIVHLLINVPKNLTDSYMSTA